MPAPRRRAGVAALIAGLGVFAGQAGELVFGSPSDLADLLYVVLVAAGLGGLTLAFWDLRSFLEHPRVARVGVRLALAGCVLLMAFAVQAGVSVATGGGVPDNFLLFGLGFLLVLVAHLLIAPGVRRSALPSAWPLSVVAAVGLAVALGTTVDPVHDIGLFVFEGAWVAFGVLLLQASDVGPRENRATAVTAG